MTARKLRKEDFDKGFMSLINEFTPDPVPIKYEDFCNVIENDPKITFVCEMDDRIVATAACILETKFHHNLMKVAHIEDVVVDKEYRGFGYGMLIVEHVLDYCKTQNCYKIILDCNLEHEAFYSKFNFVQRNIQMEIRYK